MYFNDGKEAQKLAALFLGCELSNPMKVSIYQSIFIDVQNSIDIFGLTGIVWIH